MCDPRTVNQFGEYIASSMRALLRPPHGAYLDACFRHCSNNVQDYNIHLDGTNAAYAAALWYEHGSDGLPSGGWWQDGREFECHLPRPCCRSLTHCETRHWRLDSQSCYSVGKCRAVYIRKYFTVNRTHVVSRSCHIKYVT